ncbi:MAG TPA: type II toxin-antitoxin system VapC family toxin [Candidatus Acidoferrales bacterium]|nr:type II toxin-antitoxin system VapC family toxin [Candidatus Acidoferrales bacterium]
MYLLDANACIRILNKSSLPLIERLAQHEPSEIRLSSVVKAELLFGARRSERVEENMELLARFFAPFVCLPFDDRCAEEYGLIRTSLARLGTPIGPNDLMIAATARAHALTLVSHNVGEFSRVPDLRVEDWEVLAAPDVTR